MSKINNNIYGQDKMENIQFEAKPLDVNIAKMQYNLLLRCEKEVSDNGDFALIKESYNNSDSRVNLSKIEAFCKYDKDNSANENNNRILFAVISKPNSKDKIIELYKGNKKGLLEYLKKRDFFETCKSNI